MGLASEPAPLAGCPPLSVRVIPAPRDMVLSARSRELWGRKSEEALASAMLGKMSWRIRGLQKPGAGADSGGTRRVEIGAVVVSRSSPVHEVQVAGRHKVAPQAWVGDRVGARVRVYRGCACVYGGRAALRGSRWPAGALG